MYETKTENLTEAFTAGLTDQQDPATDTYSIDESTVPSLGVYFYLVRLATPIVVHNDGHNFFIGRTAERDPSKPMLNLENLDGLGVASSVSRRHALICPVENGYEIVDLFSRNGTWIGGLRLLPNKAYPLASGDMLRVGQERLLVRYRSASSLI
jgi:pSer/pThr/pTyr-binding forkhead associated (FHA) protein